MKKTNYPKLMVDFFIDRVKKIINKLTLNKVFNEDCKIESIDICENDVRVKIDNNGEEQLLEIPKNFIGNNRDEDIFVSNMIENV